MMRPNTLALATVWLVSALPAFAQEPLTLREPSGEVRIQADRLEQVGEDGLLIATGNVDIIQGKSRLTADRVELNRETGEAVALGNAEFIDEEDRLRGERIEYNVKTRTGVVHNGSAFFPPYYRLSGKRMARVAERVYKIQDGVFTTCEADPPPWSIHAREATAYLDDYLWGRGGSFWVRNIPLIPWFPYFAAALRRERQTGFLFPTIGNSSRKGVFTQVPFYWAISDSEDLTLSLETFSSLGVGASGEYRYVLSESSRGSAGGFFIRETFKDDDDRGNFFLRHGWDISPGLSFAADINAVSSDEFFRVFGDRLGERSLQRMESTLSLTRRWESWNFAGSALWYQDLTTNRPVELQRLPELRLDAMPQPVPGVPGLLYEVESSFVNFVRDVGSDGLRADLHPRVLLPLPLGGLFTITPFAGGRATIYDKTVVGQRVTRGGGGVEVTEDEARARLLGELGADAAARASRIFDVGGVGGIALLQHVIEPRVNYSLIQGVNQSKIPQYDAGQGVVNPTGLPQADLGVDNIPKIGQITYSLTNRLNAKTVANAGQEAVRWELLRFQLNQTLDFLEDKRPLRDLQGELIVEPNRILRFRGDASFDVYGDGVQTINSDLTTTIRNITATVGSRFSDPDRIEFIRGELTAGLTRAISFRFGTNWDIRTDTIVENRFGLNYHCQCFDVAVEYIDREDDDDEIRFMVNLLGLGQLGRGAGAVGLR
ncbi:MAG: LPS-assembly protein LptD [Candidatus Methylomirabilia bacterium]